MIWEVMLTEELEVIGAAAIGAAVDKRIAKDTTGDGYLNGPCPNCGTELQGEFCAKCGQSAKDLQKPFVSLFVDVIGDVFSFDGRLARTIPALLFRPGHMTRSYLDGKRARYVPPFRLFLIASVAFFLVFFGIFEDQDWLQGDDLSINTAGVAITGLSDLEINGLVVTDLDGFEDIFDDEGLFNREQAEAFIANLEEMGAFEDTDTTPGEILDQLEMMSGQTISRAALFNAVQLWAPRLSFLLLPLYVIILIMMHFWMRRVYVFDHVIVALHLQTYLYASTTLAILYSFVSPGWAWGVFGVFLPIYLFLMLRKAYGTNWFFNLFRVFFMLNVSFIALILLVVAIALTGISEASGFDWGELAGIMDEVGAGIEEGLTNDN